MAENITIRVKIYILMLYNDKMIIKIKIYLFLNGFFKDVLRLNDKECVCIQRGGFFLFLAKKKNE